ncbi:LuxR family transcriptional regulator [soil metagenome]
MANQSRGRRLRGRAPETQVLQDLVAAVRSSAGQALVIRGEAGVGKTALLDYVQPLASGFRCTTVAGVESDMELAFAGLQQLCAPLLGHLDELPPPQREALTVAFGRGMGPTPDRFLVGLAVLSLLAAAASVEPLLCVIDDAQWLDEVSVQTLGFVARRLMAEPVALVFAVRTGGPERLTGLPELLLDGLTESDARALLDTVVVSRIDARVRDRIVAEARGIPLALLEIPHNISAAELAGGFVDTAVRPAVGQIEESFVRRITALPPATQQLLVVAAAEPVGDAALFLRAATHLDIGIEELTPAQAAGLIDIGPRIRFHHPLVRSAAYRAASLGTRRAVHRALAQATDRDADPDRRAWHAANAATGPDDVIAGELEASATRAQRRGGVAAAAAFLERAAALTADPALRGTRAIAAAQAKRDAAAPVAAKELLAIAELSPLTDLQHAQITRLRAQIEFTRSRNGEPGAPRIADAATQLLQAAQGLQPLDGESARDTYLEALAAAMYASRFGAPGATAAVAEAARSALAPLPELTRPIDHLLQGMADRISLGLGAAAPPLRAALTQWCAHAQAGEAAALPWLSLAFPIVQESAGGELWDDTIGGQLASAMVRYARDAGALAILPSALAFQAGVHLVAGELTAAASLLDEADAISAATQYQPVKYHRLHLDAWQGISESAIDAIESAAVVAKANGEGRLHGLTSYTAAVLYNGLSRYPEAYDAARQILDHDDLGFYSWCLLELVEAATYTGRHDSAADAVRQLEDRAAASGSDWGLGALAGAKALLADDPTAELLFTEAIERLERTTVVSQLARAHLRYGEWLRRMKRRPDARHHLTSAHELFTRMGAHAFAARARRELVAAGEKVRREADPTGRQLTAQEAQIAKLAADGLTNQEIGAHLFLSTHTVEWHLRKVFAKFDLTSRRQLRAVSWSD